jgi:hypothetical protein
MPAPNTPPNVPLTQDQLEWQQRQREELDSNTSRNAKRQQPDPTP